MALNISGFAERTVKFAECDGITFVVQKLTSAQLLLDQTITTAPAEAAAIIAAVDTAAKTYFGPFVGAEVSAVLAVAEPPLASLITSLGTTVSGYTPKVVAALQQIEAKLQAEATAA